MLSVCGTGAVSPAGIGADCLMRKDPWPQSSMGLITAPDEIYPVFQVGKTDEALKKWQREPRLRRASPISLYLAEAAAQALEPIRPFDPNRIGIVAAYSTGSLVYTQRFYFDIVRMGQGAASPALFPETVYNSPTSHLANLFGISGPCYSIVGDESAWVEAFRVADVWLQEGDLDHVLVVGAEEVDSAIMETYAAAHWLQGKSGFIPSEGAGAVLVGRTGGNKNSIGAYPECYSYRGRKLALQAAQNLVRGLDPQSPVFATAQGSWIERIEEDLIEARKNLNEFPYCGQAFTASAAWHTIRALSLLEKVAAIDLPIWGLNQAFSGLRLRGF